MANNKQPEGRWVTIRGRRVFIKNDDYSGHKSFTEPYTKGKRQDQFGKEIKKVTWQDRDADKKDREIAARQKEVDERNAKYADDEHKPTAMGSVKKGDFFKLSNKPNAKVYVRDEYDKSEKAYWCYEYEDVNSGRYFKKGKTVYTGFTY